MAQVTFLLFLGLGTWGLWALIRWDRRNRWIYAAMANVCFFGLFTAGLWAPKAIKSGTVDRQPSIVDRLPSMVHGAQFAVYRQPSAFIGSTIKTTYHKPDCRYATLMQHSTNYDSHDQARADGKTPCKICLPGQ